MPDHLDAIKADPAYRALRNAERAVELARAEAEHERDLRRAAERALAALGEEQKP